MQILPAFLCFGPDWLLVSGLALGFSSSKSSTASTSSTTNQVTDQRVAASEGSVSAGAGASININNSDTEAITRLAEIHDASLTEGLSNSLKAAQNIAVAGVDSNTAVTRAALAAGGDQLATVTSLGRDVVGAGVQQTRDSLDFGERALSIATSAANQSQAQTNDLIQRTNEQFTAKLASNAGDAPQAVAQDAIKYGALALAGIAALFVFFRPSSAK